MISLRICWASILVMSFAGCGGRAELESPRGSTSFDSDAGPDDPALGANAGSGSAGAPSSSGSAMAGSSGTSTGGASATGGRGAVAGSSASTGGAPASGGRGAVAGGDGMSVGGSSSTGGRGAVAGSGGMSKGGVPAVGGGAGQAGMPSVEPEEPPPDEPPPMVPLPPGCTTAYQTVTTSSCEHQFLCQDGEIFAFCRDQGGGSIACNCEGVQERFELTVDGANMDSACIIAATECQNPTAPAEGSVCEVVQESAGVDYCNVGRECSTEVETSSGRLIRRKTFENAECSTFSDSWECSCYERRFGGNRQIGLALGSDLAARDACLRASEVCDEEPFVFSDDLNCRMEDQRASRDFCEAQLSCRVPGTSQEGTPVYAASWARTYCQQEGPETWTCECESFEQDGLMSISVQAADSWTACQQSAAECFPQSEF